MVNTMAKMVLNTKTGLVAAIGSLARRGAAFKKDAQLVAIAVMEHIDKTGDYTSTALPLFKAIDVTSPNLGAAMREYFLAHTWLVVNEDPETKSDKPFVKDQSKKMLIDDAKGVLWYETERPAKTVYFDAQKAVETLLKRAAKQNKTDDALEAMKAVVAKMEKEQADETAKAKELVSGK